MSKVAYQQYRMITLQLGPNQVSQTSHGSVSGKTYFSMSRKWCMCQVNASQGLTYIQT